MTASDLFITLDSSTAARPAARFVQPERPAGDSALKRLAARFRTAPAPVPAPARA
jgi:hypothetical protein